MTAPAPPPEPELPAVPPTALPEPGPPAGPPTAPPEPGPPEVSPTALPGSEPPAAPTAEVPEPEPPAAPTIELAELIHAARRAAAQHRRRRYPDTRACALCGWPWRTGTTQRGRPWRGCPGRREALELLDEAGLLDADGRPTPPLDRRPAPPGDGTVA